MFRFVRLIVTDHEAQAAGEEPADVEESVQIRTGC